MSLRDRTPTAASLRCEVASTCCSRLVGRIGLRDRLVVVIDRLAVALARSARIGRQHPGLRPV
jgi:hypothetical protein